MSKIVRPANAREQLGVSNTTLYDLVKRGELPRPFKIGKRASAFLQSDLDAFIDRKRSESTAATAA